MFNMAKDQINDIFQTGLQPLLDWFYHHRRPLPWREHRTPWRVWVSEIMLQQTQVQTVIPYFLRFIQAFPSPEALSTADPATVYKLWEGLGYYSRCRNLIKGAAYVTTALNGIIPKTVDQLIKIPGIGPYTAGAIASLAFNEPAAAVDGNVLRVWSRLLNLPWRQGEAKDRLALSQSLQNAYNNLAESKQTAFRHAYADISESFIELGALICTPKQPKCDICPLQNACQALLANTVLDRPLKPIRKKKPVEYYTVIVLKDWEKNKFLLHQRRSTALLQHLWEWPRLEGTRTLAEIKTAFESTASKRIFIPLGTVTQTFTHLVWEITGYLIDTQNPKADLEQISGLIDDDPTIWQTEIEWVDATALSNYAMPKTMLELRQRMIQIEDTLV